MGKERKIKGQHPKKSRTYNIISGLLALAFIYVGIYTLIKPSQNSWFVLTAVMAGWFFVTQVWGKK